MANNTSEDEGWSFTFSLTTDDKEWPGRGIKRTWRVDRHGITRRIEEVRT